MSRNLTDILRAHEGEDRPTALAVLKEAMDERGEITDDDRRHAAALSGLPEATVYGISSFYDDLVQPRGQRTLAVRNGPAANVVRVSYGAGQEQHRLAPGELKSIRLAPSRGRDGVPVTISSEAGFRPGDLEAGNRDLRFLGLWVELR